MGTTKQATQTHRSITRLLACAWPLWLLGLIATAWCVRPVADIDVQWHLKAGAWMLDHGRVITEDFYSVSKWGREWTSVPWLYEVLLAWLHRHLGWWGPTLWQWLVALAVAAQTVLLVCVLRRRGTRWDWRWPALSAPAALAVLETLRVLEVRFQHRPEMTTHALLGTYVLLLTLWRRREHPWARWAVWLLVPLQAWWANTHGVFVLGPLVIGAFAAAEWLATVRRWSVLGARWSVSRGAGAEQRPDGIAESPDRNQDSPSTLHLPPSTFHPAPSFLSRPLALTALLIASAAACFLSPYGYRSALYPVHLFRVLTEPVYKYGISEALPVTWGFLWRSGIWNRLLVAGWALAGVGLVVRLIEGALRGAADAANRHPESGIRNQQRLLQNPCQSGRDGARPSRKRPVFDNGGTTSVSSAGVLQEPQQSKIENPEFRLRCLGAWRVLADDLGIGYVLTCMGLAYVSVTAIRNVPLFGLVGAPLLASGIEALADGLAWLGRRAAAWVGGSARAPRMPGLTSAWARARVPAARVLLALLLVVLYRSIVSERYYEATGRPTRFAIGHSDHEFPLAGVDFLEARLPGMAPLATFGDTRSEDIFLNRLGPTWKTFIDGRHAEIYDAPFFAAYGETLGRQGVFFQEAGKYGVGYAIFSLQDMHTGREGLAAELYRHPGWALMYLDDCAAVFAATVPTNMPAIARYALPPPPENWAEQRPAFGAWLQRHDWRRLEDLYRPENAAMNSDTAALALPRVLQLGGLWQPRRNLPAWRMGRLAAFLSALQWRVAADDLYDVALAGAPLHRRVAEFAVNHAIECYDSCPDPDLKAVFLGRVRARSEALRREAPGAPAALYGLAFADANSGDLLAARTRLESLRRRRRDVVILDHLARVYGELGDRAATPEEKRGLWRQAIRAWRDRLSRYPAGPGTYRAYLRLGDLFQRLEEPLLARANYVNALGQPDIPPALAETARAKVADLETSLFGGSYAPGARVPAHTPNPYQFPVASQAAPAEGQGAESSRMPGAAAGPRGPRRTGPGSAPGPGAATNAPLPDAGPGALPQHRLPPRPDAGPDLMQSGEAPPE